MSEQTMSLESLRENIGIGIITALPKEYAAMRGMLENSREYPVYGYRNTTRYLIGQIPTANGKYHAVVLSLLPVMGNNSASGRATLLLEHFPFVRSIIMVGIAGGAPNPSKVDEHVRLGDIVVSNQQGVVQYDYQKETIACSRELLLHRLIQILWSETTVQVPLPLSLSQTESVEDALCAGASSSDVKIVPHRLLRMRFDNLHHVPVGQTAQYVLAGRDRSPIKGFLLKLWNQLRHIVHKWLDDPEHRRTAWNGAG